MIAEVISSARKELTNIQRETEEICANNAADQKKIESILSSLKKQAAIKMSTRGDIREVRHYVTSLVFLNDDSSM